VSKKQEVMRDGRKLHNAEILLFVLLTNYYAVMSGAMYSRKEKCIQNFGELNWRKEAALRT
jgi:hypothetical protein